MKIGVLLINTGTADAPTKEAIRPYLTEFLMDPAIIGAPLFIRRPLVNHIVSRRPERTVAHYQAFWTSEGSPFVLMSKMQCAALSNKLNSDTTSDTEYICALSMRYGNPSIRCGLEQLRKAGCERVVLLPLYPQNVNVCAGTCLLEAHKCLQEYATEGWNPKVSEVKSFHDHPAYRQALAKSVSAHWQYKPGSKLVVSFHSTMMKDIKKDDTYLRQATETKDWLAESLDVPSQDAVLGFQSRFDSRKWLKPFTEQILRNFAEEGVRDVCIVTPGFVADNIETMIEVNRDLRQLFEYGVPAKKQIMGHVARQTVKDQSELDSMEKTKKRNFTYVPALGCADGLIETLADCVRKAE